MVKGRIQDPADLHSVGAIGTAFTEMLTLRTLGSHTTGGRSCSFKLCVLQQPDPEASTREEVHSSGGTVVGNATARLEKSEHYVSTNSRLQKPTVWYPQSLSLLRSAIQARVSFSDSDIISPTAKAVRGVSSLSLLY